MPIAQLGAVNVSALNVPQALIQIVPPQYLFNGTPTNICGVVGTANWGPVGLAQTFGSYAQGSQIFGPTVNRLYDMMGSVMVAQMQGAAYFSGVRITDGTDVAATAAIPAGASASGTFTWITTQPANTSTLTIGTTTVTFVTGTPTTNQVQIGGSLAVTLNNLILFLNASSDAQISKLTYTLSGVVITGIFKVQGTTGNSFVWLASSSPNTNATASGAGTLTGGTAPTTGFTATGKYTGSFGNGVQVILQTGSQSGTIKVVITSPGNSPEIFDNIGFGVADGALWIAIVAAINNGTTSVRPGSNTIVATVGASTNAPVLNSPVTLSGGTDGVTSITTALFLGTDALPRTGMYALRNQQTSQFTLCDCSDMAALSTMVAFGLSEGSEGILATPSGDTLGNAATELSNQGIDSFTVSVVFGDWAYFIDTVNNIAQRIISPASVKLGILGNLSPQNSPLNKPVNGIVGTQSTFLGRTYSYSDFQQLSLARMDVLALDRSLTNNFIFRLGVNTSSNAVIEDDSYTRVTYFLAKSLQIIANQYIGSTITPAQMRQAKIAFQAFLSLQVINGIVGTFDGTQAYQVILDATNNQQQTVALGYEYAYIKVIYFGILRYFIVDLEGGASVTIVDTLTALPTVSPTI